jgi:hypothetical protein
MALGVLTQHVARSSRVGLNRDALPAYWNREIGVGALIHRLQRAPA